MSATDIPAIGAHCALERCNVNDFLPIKCRCELLFCREHIQPEEHSCPLLETIHTPKPGEPAEKMQRCAAGKCNKLSLEAFIVEKHDKEGRTPALCPHCQKAFCARYALQILRRCTLHRISTTITVIVTRPRMGVLLKPKLSPIGTKLQRPYSQKYSPLRLYRSQLALHRPRVSLQSARPLRQIRRRLLNCVRSSL